MTEVIDVAIDVTKRIPQLKAVGIKTIIRYLTAGGGQKLVREPEARAIGNAGLELGLVYQVYNNADKYFSSAQGANAATWTKNYCTNVLKAPRGTVIYFAVDYDARKGVINGQITEYFKAVRSVLVPTYRVGVYGSGLTCRLLKEAGLVDKVWITQSMGYQESRKAVANGNYDLLQRLSQRIAGITVDPNVINPGHEIGTFVPYKKPEPIKPAAAIVTSGVAAAVVTPHRYWPWVAVGTGVSLIVGLGIYYWVHFRKKV